MDEKSGFVSFVYSLVYPAILGSMLYDALLQTHYSGYLPAAIYDSWLWTIPSPKTTDAGVCNNLSRLFIVIIFLCDWSFVFAPRSRRQVGKYAEMLQTTTPSRYPEKSDARKAVLRDCAWFNLCGVCALVTAYGYVDSTATPWASMAWLCGLAAAYILCQGLFLKRTSSRITWIPISTAALVTIGLVIGMYRMPDAAVLPHDAQIPFWRVCYLGVVLLLYALLLLIWLLPVNYERLLQE
ncbi:MAG: hypothetical protein DWQ34_16095 [Planctomycetota bacterium]|nr:MAG: hypothetical protein DWQ34_16095 [Planctomycetota bacterium]REJ94808.1 MAG: hypothetical protein DWQ29_02605 [Planctomycetota bacterium]REK30996.1 MAG: hypothetical protein DWQ41_00805 [Planctomycetota bacterium]REK36888.1 MAG: hypothetical protein DWQ45_09805 [Planctomycetota bacterium]